MSVSIKIGPDIINSYRRLAYQPWYALAEFVDNSTQSYFDNRSVLDQSYAKTKEVLTVRVVYDSNPEMLRITDNSIGMNLDDLDRALHIAKPPINTKGRSKYGLGLKTAACWLGNEWLIRTKKLGETVEHQVIVNVESIASGNSVLPYKRLEGKSPSDHYTIIEITKHNRAFKGRTLGKIKDYLQSMYREDFRNKSLVLEWNGTPLAFQELDERLLISRDGTPYRKEFSFEVNEKAVRGWIGILGKGGRPYAGFSIIHCGRVVRGSPDAWRPESLYGQTQGSNDLINQRLVGEIHLDHFEVSHTKDDILWLGDEEDLVQELLEKHCGDYKEIARSYRKGNEDARGPDDAEIDAARDELEKEIRSPEMVDKIKIEEVPPEEVVKRSVEHIVSSIIASRESSFFAKIDTLEVRGYLASDMSPNDPYVSIDATQEKRVVIVINLKHPHMTQLKGSDGVLNYFRHCTYDGIAEWKALHKASRLDPQTIKLLKDALLRVPIEMEIHQSNQ